MFMVMSVLILILNVISMILASISKSEMNEGNVVITRAVNLSEMLSTVNLFVVWIADVSFGETFILSEELWRSGAFCHIASAFSLWFTFTDPAILFLLALCWFMVVNHPVDSQFKTAEFSNKCVVYILLSLSVSTIVLSLTLVLTTDCVSTAICVPFLDPENLCISRSIHRNRSGKKKKGIMWITVWATGQTCKEQQWNYFLQQTTILNVCLFEQQSKHHMSNNRDASMRIIWCVKSTNHMFCCENNRGNTTCFFNNLLLQMWKRIWAIFVKS